MPHAWPICSTFWAIGRTTWTGAYWHPARQAIFVGDLIDRGDDQLRVLEIVNGMVEGGSAQIVMGNHEFNAIGYATERLSLTPSARNQFGSATALDDDGGDDQASLRHPPNVAPSTYAYVLRHPMRIT